jgi:Zn-finger nucleic acid-binding protein
VPTYYDRRVDCPKDHRRLTLVRIGSIRVQRCPECGGTWYPKDQLRLLKDRASRGDYRWIDVDLWKDAARFRAAKQERYACPADGSPMTTVRYGDSEVRIDICSTCAGAWLDRGEYERILAHLERVVLGSSVNDYLDDVREEFVEVFTGPEGPGPELRDLAKIIYLLQLRFTVEHPRIVGALQGLPRV